MDPNEIKNGRLQRQISTMVFYASKTIRFLALYLEVSNHWSKLAILLILSFLVSLDKKLNQIKKRQKL